MQLQFDRGLEFTKKGLLGGKNIKLRSSIRAELSSKDKELIEKYGDPDTRVRIYSALKSETVGIKEQHKSEVMSVWDHYKGQGGKVSDFAVRIEADEGALGSITTVEIAIQEALKQGMKYLYDLEGFAGSYTVDISE